MKTKTVIIILGLLGFLSRPLVAEPMGTAFTYIGHLAENGRLANGTYAMRFTLYDSALDGHIIGQPRIESAVTLSNGLFTVLLDFSMEGSLRIHPFSGEARWLEIGVDRSHGSNFAILSPRQPLTPTPYALFAPFAGSVPAAGLTGTLADARLSVNVPLLDSSPTFNGSVTANNYLRALRLHIGMSCDASGSLATIAGGFFNTNLGALSFLGQGMTNTIQTNTVRAFLGGGTGNTIQRSANYSFLGGGSDNTIRTNADYSFLGGGSANTIRTNADYATLGGGYLNDIGGAFATVPGGAYNDALGEYSFAAGRNAKADHAGTFVWADAVDTAFHSSQSNQFAVRANGGMYVEGSGGFPAPLLHLHQTDSERSARLRFSVAGVNLFWTIDMEPENDPDLRFYYGGSTNRVTIGTDGSVTADAFDGNGSRLTGLNASAITTGTVPDARLSANVARLVDGCVTADAFNGDGSRLTGLNANAITTMAQGNGVNTILLTYRTARGNRDEWRGP